jgi:ribose/xylose/arabinose/galactoside ABC-type transport system permease subunit
LRSVPCGIDLSVGSVAALTGVVAAKTVQGNPDMFVSAVVGGIGVGLICGLINGTSWLASASHPSS